MAAIEPHAPPAPTAAAVTVNRSRSVISLIVFVQFRILRKPWTRRGADVLLPQTPGGCFDLRAALLLCGVLCAMHPEFDFGAYRQLRRLLVRPNVRAKLPAEAALPCGAKEN